MSWINYAFATRTVTMRGCGETLRTAYRSCLSSLKRVFVNYWSICHCIKTNFTKKPYTSYSPKLLQRYSRDRDFFCQNPVTHLHAGGLCTIIVRRNNSVINAFFILQGKLQKSQKAEMKASIDEFESKLSSCRAKGTEGETREETDSPVPVVPAKRTKQSRSSKASI